MTVQEMEKTLRRLPPDAWLEDDADYAKFDVFVKRPGKPRLWLGGIHYEGFMHYRPSSIQQAVGGRLLSKKDSDLADEVLGAVEAR